MIRDPILDELQETRERLLAEAGGTLEGLVAKLQREERCSGREFYTKSRAHDQDETTGSNRAVTTSSPRPPARWPRYARGETAPASAARGVCRKPFSRSGAIFCRQNFTVSTKFSPILEIRAGRHLVEAVPLEVAVELHGGCVLRAAWPRSTSCSAARFWASARKNVLAMQPSRSPTRSTAARRAAGPRRQRTRNRATTDSCCRTTT